MIIKLIKKLFEPMPLNEFSDYDEYWKKRGFSAPAKKRAEVASKYIKENSKILDVAFGGGESIFYLNDKKKPSRICNSFRTKRRS